MSLSFTKLFSSITESTIWVEPDHVRIMWITMLAMADRRGRIWASVPGLANRARVTVEHCEEALARLSQPDKYSRTPDNDGRRIEPIDGGWRLLNYDKYREMRDVETTREAKRNYINRKRHADDTTENVDKPHLHPSTVDQCRTLSNQAEAEAEAEAENIRSRPNSSGRAPRAAAPTDAEWVAGLKSKPVYAGIAVENELQKAQTWCEANNRKCSRRFFTNWLNRCEQSMAPNSGKARTWTPDSGDF